MRNSEQKSGHRAEASLSRTRRGRRDMAKPEVRFWQTVALSLAIFAIGLVASLVIGLTVMLISR